MVLKKFQSVFTLNKVLPDLCEAAGVKRKTAHCLRVTYASSLFNAGVEEKLIRERTGHRSNALLKYEKPSFHEGTFQNCNFHVVNNFSKYVRE